MLARAVLSLVPRPRPDTLPQARLATAVTVDRAHLAAYQRVCGFRVGDRLPLTYPHVLGFASAMRLMTGPGFPFPVVGLVHVGNRIEQRRPLSAEDALTIEVHAADLRDHPRGRQFDMVTTASADGEEVWRDVSTYLKVTRGADKSGPRDKPQPPEPHAIWRVGPQAGADYARVSGDHNPIHTSRLGARLFGFARPIAHGMWTKARCVAALEGRLPERVTVEVAFKAPILLPAKVGFAYTGELAVFDVRSGRPHLTGTVQPG